MRESSFCCEECVSDGPQAARMRIEEVAELQFAFPTFTEGVQQAAEMLVRELGIRAMPRPWGSLSVPAP